MNNSTMKKLYIVLLISGGIFASACSKGVLDKLPLDNITEMQVWSDPLLIDAYLTQAYTQTTVFENDLTEQPYVSNGSWHFAPFIVNSVSDESKFNRTWAGNANTFKAGGIRIAGGLMEWWETPYSVIRNLNNFIAKVPSSPISNDLKITRVAEARFLRAFNYFSIVKRYGGVPLILDVQNINDADSIIYPARNTEAEIYDFVISEVNDIAPSLPEVVGDADYGRPSRYAALALKCRAALYAASIAQFGQVQQNGLTGIPAARKDSYYQASLDASTAIMNSGHFQLYNLKPTDKAANFRNLFLDERNSETIFARQHDERERSVGGNGWQYDFFEAPVPNGWGGGNQDGVYLEMAEEFEYTDGRPGTLDRVALQNGLWNLQDLWRNKDPRFFASIYTQNTPWKGSKVDYHKGILKPDGTITNESYNGIVPAGPNKYTGFGVLKYLDEAKDNLNSAAIYSSKIDWIVFRYAEILLNHAEACFETGRTSEALTLVNMIRDRAGIAQLGMITREAIHHERKVELAFEGHRYWDIRRWRIGQEALTVNRTGLQYVMDPQSDKFKLIVLTKQDGANNPIFYDYNYYFPITKARTNINKNLLENAGYQ